LKIPVLADKAASLIKDVDGGSAYIRSYPISANPLSFDFALSSNLVPFTIDQGARSPMWNDSGVVDQCSRAG
jgi:hypothetical protein